MIQPSRVTITVSTAVLPHQTTLASTREKQRLGSLNPPPQQCYHRTNDPGWHSLCFLYPSPLQFYRTNDTDWHSNKNDRAL